MKRKPPQANGTLRKRHPNIVDFERRIFLKQSLSLGALAMLAGCDPTSQSATQQILLAMSRWNDRAQAALFNPRKLAPTYTESEITDPFPFNAYYTEDEVPVVPEQGFRLELGGMVADREPWTLERLREFPQSSQITRHICVEGWSAIGKWGGVPFRDFLQRVGADLTASYVGFKCADQYYSSIDMATALHPQTILALTYRDQTLPARYGFPMKLRVPTKLGFKNPKHIMAIYVTNIYPGGYWEDQGYNWFSGS